MISNIPYLLRRFQLWTRKKIKNLLNTNVAIIIVMLNAGIIASYQKECTNSVIDLRQIAQLVGNSLLFFVVVDFNVRAFSKMIIGGAVSHIATSEFISLYMRYIKGYGTRCEMPIYVSGYFAQTVVFCVFFGLLYYIFTGNSYNTSSIKDDAEIDSDFN